MLMKKMLCIVLAYVMAAGTLLIPVSAAELQTSAFDVTSASARATGSFSMDISAKSNSVSSSSFRLSSGETITIKAYYTPTSASVDFGVIAPDGKYYYFSATNGNIEKTMQVNQSGYYTLKIVNNSSDTVSVSGFITY